ncbi:uncharacterized protein M6B38_328185 [Iris pallida]|uniref:Uncharacterized protein n=1 Tax=Iris pallida TaxID=29817 RepID=A0AAX6H6B6_IRIPA|nr:uncharacterized protein M6B38_328185 [Iris pallida]
MPPNSINGFGKPNPFPNATKLYRLTSDHHIYHSPLSLPTHQSPSSRWPSSSRSATPPSPHAPQHPAQHPKPTVLQRPPSKKRPPQVPPLPRHRLRPPARRREYRLAPPPLHHPHLRLLRVPPAPLRPLPLRAHPGKQWPTAPPNYSRRLPGMDGRRPQEPRHTARQLRHVRGLRDRGLHVPLAPPAACCSTSRLAGIQRPGLSRDFQAADEPDVQLHACCRWQRPLVEVLPATDHAVAAFGRDRVQHGQGGRDRGAEAAETERRRAQGLPRGPFASAGVELLTRPKRTQVWSRGGLHREVVGLPRVRLGGLRVVRVTEHSFGQPDDEPGGQARVERPPVRVGGQAAPRVRSELGVPARVAASGVRRENESERERDSDLAMGAAARDTVGRFHRCVPEPLQMELGAGELEQGVCIIGWPLASEQFYNSKMVEEELRVGTEFTRGTEEEVRSEAVEAAVRLVIVGDEGRKMKERAGKYRRMIREAMREDGEVSGSSIRSVDELIEMAMSSSRSRSVQ